MTESSTPAISIVMPVYNCEDFVAEALQSILRQTWMDFECLLIDDGSTDGTVAQVMQVAGDDERMVLISKPNTGLVDSLNYGLLRARASVVARMDGDDICYLRRLERQVELLELSRCAAVSSSFIQIDEFGNEIGLHTPADVRDADPDRVPPREPYLPHPFMMFRRDAVLEIGGYRHCLHSEDADLCWRLHQKYAIWNIPEVLGRYRLHTASVSSNSSESARLQAVSAQLSAICIRRAREGRSGIRFDLDRHEATPHAANFDGLLALYDDQLDAEEQARLSLGASLRFLDFARFRGYPVELGDIAFARCAMRQHRKLLGDDLGWAEWVVQEAIRCMN